MINTMDKVRVLLVGDSGVGKTCVTHLIAHNESLTRPGWTVGCNIEVKLYDYKPNTNENKSYWVELFDVGGSLSHKAARSIFYTPTHGIILVHDLTNRKSHANLREWLYEILDKDGKDTYKFNSFSNPAPNDTSGSGFDPEEFFGVTHIPILVMGTKLDLIDERRRPTTALKSGGIAEQCGAEEIWLNCCDPSSVSNGTPDALKLTNFFDRVIERKQSTQDNNYYYGPNYKTERRRGNSNTMII